MLNLIPPVAYKTVKREYMFRVVTVWLMMLAAVFIIVSVLMIPTYIMVAIERANYIDSMSAVESHQDAISDREEEIKTTNHLAEVIIAEPTSFSLTAHMNLFQKYAGEGILIQSYQYDLQKDTPMIRLVGTATTRGILASFRDKLESDTAYVEVDLPISSLVKDVDVPFTISLTLATTTSAL